MAKKKADCGCPFGKGKGEPDGDEKPGKGKGGKAAFGGKKAMPFGKKGKGK